MTHEQTVAMVMRYLNNFFEVGNPVYGTFTIRGGSLQGEHPKLWVYISGSMFNDGVHNLRDGEELLDETFDGHIWYLKPLPDFLALCERIKDFDEKHGSDPVVSESFGNYSHSFAQADGGGAITWQSQFRQYLTPYRHMFTEVS